MAKTSRRTWQKREQAAAAPFGADRQYGSGSGGRDDQTSSDSTHPRLYIEHKLRAKHAVLTLWSDCQTKARKEGKDPVVILSEKGRHGQWLVLHTSNLVTIMANRIAAMQADEIADLLAAAEQYRQADGGEGKWDKD
jgi:hypothetical protein